MIWHGRNLNSGDSMIYVQEIGVKVTSRMDVVNNGENVLKTTVEVSKSRVPWYTIGPVDYELTLPEALKLVAVGMRLTQENGSA